MLRNGEKFGLVENQEGYDGGQDIRPYGEPRNIHSKVSIVNKLAGIPNAHKDNHTQYYPPNLFHNQRGCE